MAPRLCEQLRRALNKAEDSGCTNHPGTDALNFPRVKTGKLQKQNLKKEFLSLSAKIYSEISAQLILPTQEHSMEKNISGG